MYSYRDFKDFVLSYQYDKDQLFLVSFPKTGRTWLRHMIDSMIDESNQNLNIFYTHDHSEILTEDGIKNNTELIFKNIKRFRFRRAKVIFLVRNPKDVIVSHYHQITKRSLKPLKFSSMSSFIRNNELGFNRIIHFYNLWYKQKKVVRDFFLVKYEDLIENSDSLFLLSKFLKLKINYKVVEQIYDEHKFEKMREKEVKGQLKDSMSFGNDENFLKVRKAIVGSYKNEMNMDDIHFCNESLKNLNSFYEY